MPDYHKGCGGVIAYISSSVKGYNVETAVCLRCGGVGQDVRIESREKRS